MEQRLINANDPVLWRLSAVKEDGCRYISWEALAEVPTAEVCLRRGGWSRYDISGKAVKTGCVCTRCGEWNNRKTNYCPCCGARMDGGTV